ncbi:MAG: hypothetical protein ACK53L_01020, partial [Pirellulaceae bacterium]
MPTVNEHTVDVHIADGAEADVGAENVVACELALLVPVAIVVVSVERDDVVTGSAVDVSHGEKLARSLELNAALERL